MIEDYCEFFKKIKKDPKAPVDISVREYLLASHHAHHCKECLEIVNSFPDDEEDINQIGFGRN